MAVPQERGGDGPFAHYPAWCAVVHHGSGKHRSEAVEVDGTVGGIRAWLVERDAVNGPYVALNAHIAAGITVDLTLDDLAELHGKLGELLKQAGRP